MPPPHYASPEPECGVAAIDKSGYGSDTLSTHALARAGVHLLSSWGVLDAIRAEGTPRAERISFHYGDTDVAIDVSPRGDVDGLYSPRRTVLDRVLVDAAIESGAHVPATAPRWPAWSATGAASWGSTSTTTAPAAPSPPESSSGPTALARGLPNRSVRRCSGRSG